MEVNITVNIPRRVHICENTRSGAWCVSADPMDKQHNLKRPRFGSKLINGTQKKSTGTNALTESTPKPWVCKYTTLQTTGRTHESRTRLTSLTDGLHKSLDFTCHNCRRGHLHVILLK
jgi:hypothetical protein